VAINVETRPVGMYKLSTKKLRNGPKQKVQSVCRNLKTVKVVLHATTSYGNMDNFFSFSIFKSTIPRMIVYWNFENLLLKVDVLHNRHGHVIEL
jgi:hypothetical protein